MLIDVLLILGGIGLLWACVWRRRGRSGGRSWARRTTDRRTWLLALPSGGLMLVAVGVMRVGDDVGLPALTMSGVLVFAIGGVMILWGLLFLPIPSWYLPAWLRPVVARERREARERRQERHRRRAQRSARAR